MLTFCAIPFKSRGVKICFSEIDIKSALKRMREVGENYHDEVDLYYLKNNEWLKLTDTTLYKGGGKYEIKNYPNIFYQGNGD